LKSTVKNIFTFCLTKLVSLGPTKSIAGFRSILVLAPHPDDEILGLGGIILQTLQQGGKVHLVYLTDGECSDVWHDREEIKRQRITLSERVCMKLGISIENINSFASARWRITV